MGDKTPNALFATIDVENLDFKSFEELLESWQDTVEEGRQCGGEALTNQSKISEINTLAEQSLRKLVAGNFRDRKNAPELFWSLDMAALICDKAGQIQRANIFAQQQFAIAENTNISSLNFSLEGGRNLSGTVLKQFDNQTESLQILQATPKHGSMQHLALFVFPTTCGQINFLIMFISIPWTGQLESLLFERLKLSAAEGEVVKLFAQGLQLKEIASLRDRSYPTIHNQFQTALEKTGCANQSELLRLVFGTSFMFAQVQALSKKDDRQPGRPMLMARANGRQLDVRIFGDPCGAPFVAIPSIFGHPVTPEIERQLEQRGMQMIGVARPGFGETSQPVGKDSLNTCFASDLSALLDSMEIERCVLMSRASAARSAFNVSKHLGDRNCHNVMVNSLVPRRFVKRRGVGSKWTVSLMSASRLAPAVATTILATGKKLMEKTGPSTFLERMYRQADLDRAVAQDPEVAVCMQTGVDFVTRYGLAAGARDMIDGFQDWTDEVREVDVQTTLVHGKYDPHVPMDAVRKFVGTFPDQLQLIEIEDGVGLLNFSHAEFIFDLISDRGQ